MDEKPYIIKWAWRHHSLDADEFSDMDDAIASAGYAADAGHESLDCIEVWDGTGHRVIERDDALALAWAHIEANEAARPEPPRNVARVEITGPGGSVATFGYPTMEAAEARAAEFRSHLGDKRVAVRRIER